MRRIYLLTLLILVGGVLAAGAGEYRMLNGDVVRGEPVSFNEDGFVVRLDIGGYSDRISWSRLTQESLKELKENPKAAPYVEPFIYVPPEVRAAERAKRREIALRDVPRVEQPPPEQRSIAAGLTTPIGITFLVVLYLLNLYVGYEVGKVKSRPPGLVCFVAAILPVLGPVIFMVMPAGDHQPAEEETGAVQEAPAAAPAVNPMQGGGVPAGSASNLSLSGAGGGGAAAAAVDIQAYARGEHNFNRKFFETTFPGFFRVVPRESEKDLVLHIKTARGEYLVKRISRISMNEMHVQTLRGGQSEVSIPFSEVTQVQVRHKDAKK